MGRQGEKMSEFALPTPMGDIVARPLSGEWHEFHLKTFKLGEFNLPDIVLEIRRFLEGVSRRDPFDRRVFHRLKVEWLANEKFFYRELCQFTAPHAIIIVSYFSSGKMELFIHQAHIPVDNRLTLGQVTDADFKEWARRLGCLYHPVRPDEDTISDRPEFRP